MKTTISFVLVAFLILLGSAKSDVVSAVQPTGNQLKSGSADRTISHRFTSWSWTPLSCDGAVIGGLWVELDVHCVMHYENGAVVWMIMRYTGSFTNQDTKEVFKINEVNTNSLPQPGTITFRSNVIGDKGSHIITSGTINPETWEFTFNKSVCN
jgi:hypothetical protein